MLWRTLSFSLSVPIILFQFLICETITNWNTLVMTITSFIITHYYYNSWCYNNCMIRKWNYMYLVTSMNKFLISAWSSQCLKVSAMPSLSKNELIYFFQRHENKMKQKFKKICFPKVPYKYFTISSMKKFIKYFM